MSINPTRLFQQPVAFLRGVTSIAQLPPANVPEVAFVGRSNVGKSSLINALTKRQSLARTSKTPGCTQQLNFFAIGEEPELLRIVDLPGYGYAKASKREVAGWHRLMVDFLQCRPNLKQVFLLLDGRHPIKKSDEEMMDILDEVAISYRIIFTKLDKLSQKEQANRAKEHEKLGSKHPALHPEFEFVSAHKGENIQSIRNIMAGLL